MDLYLIRHAEAQPRGEGGIDDAERPLTSAGHGQCGPLASTLRQQGVRLEHIVTSPLLRARQTADDLIKELGAPASILRVCDHLSPGGKRRKLTRFLCGLRAKSVAIVGHAPDLNLYLGWLIGSRKAQVDLTKSGVACIHFEEEPAKGAGLLTWMVTPQWYK
jgi:phosphohistidine phosphatase